MTTIFRYVRDEHGHPIAAMAALINGDSVTIGWSKKHPKDKSSKKLARLIAVGRAHAGRCKPPIPPDLWPALTDFAVRLSQKFGCGGTIIGQPPRIAS